MALVSVDANGRPDGVWRVEPRAGLYDLRWRGALVLQGVTLDRCVEWMLEQGFDPATLVER